MPTLGGHGVKQAVAQVVAHQAVAIQPVAIQPVAHQAVAQPVAVPTTTAAMVRTVISVHPIVRRITIAMVKKKVQFYNAPRALCAKN